MPESRPVLAAAAWQPPRIVIEDNLLEPGDTAAASLCDTAAAPVLLDPADLGRLPAGLLSLSGNRTGRDLASGGAPNRDAPEEFGERAPARILDLQTNAQGGEILFQYAVSAPGSEVPCTVELWPPGRPFEGVSTFDSLSGSKRAAAVSVPGGGRHQYRLMCGGDLQRGVIP